MLVYVCSGEVLQQHSLQLTLGNSRYVHVTGAYAHAHTVVLAAALSFQSNTKAKSSTRLLSKCNSMETRRTTAEQPVVGAVVPKPIDETIPLARLLYVQIQLVRSQLAWYRSA